MVHIEREVYLRNYIMAVLSSYSDKGLQYSNMGALADDLTEAVIEGDLAWSEENCMAQVSQLEKDFEEDVPQ